MSRTDDVLLSAFRDLENCVSHLATNPASGPERTIERLVFHLEEEPLRSFLEATVDHVEFDSWWAKNAKKCEGMGAGEIDWPHRRTERVSVQVELLRRIAIGTIDYLDFTVNFTNPNCSAHIPEHTRHFVFLIIKPLVEDIRRLSESRVLPAGVNAASAQMIRSGDNRLDELIAEALRLFRDTAPSANRLGLEKLWDAWERLKSMDATEKKESIELRIRRVLGGGKFAELVDAEARELTRIGNKFAIRHHETKVSEIASAREIDYLFHRMPSIIVLLVARPNQRELQEASDR